MRKVLAVLAALVAFSVGAPTAAPQAAAPNENASCIAHGVHGPPGPPGLFRSQFGPDFPFPLGHRVSEIARTEGGSFAECLAALNP